MKKISLFFLFFLFFTFISCTQSMRNQEITIKDSAKNFKADDITDHYPAPWNIDYRPRLQKILGENHIKNCSKPQYRLNTSGRSYLVKCESGLYYIAWLGQEIVGGPYSMRKGSMLDRGRSKETGKYKIVSKK